MIIAVDIGNSNIVIGGIQNDRILFEARLRTDATKTSDEYSIDLKQSAGAFAYYIKRDSDFVKLPSVDFGKLYTGSFGEPIPAISRHLKY